MPTDLPPSDTLDRLGLAVIVPLIALLATTGLLAPEIDDGSISYLLAKPISRHTIVISKLAVAACCVLVFAAVPMLLAGPRPDARRHRRSRSGSRVGSLVGGTAYCALFALLSVMTRHAVVVGLIYLLIWEGLLGGLLDGVRWLSITRWARAIVEPVADVDPRRRPRARCTPSSPPPSSSCSAPGSPAAGCAPST